MDEQLLDSNSIQKWMSSSSTEKAQILRNLFAQDYTPLGPPELAALSTYMSLEGYNIPSTTTAMLAVLHCFEEAGGVETSEDETQTLLVRVNNGSR